jgi:hypothetical protein
LAAVAGAALGVAAVVTAPLADGADAADDGLL